MKFLKRVRRFLICEGLPLRGGLSSVGGIGHPCFPGIPGEERPWKENFSLVRSGGKQRRENGFMSIVHNKKQVEENMGRNRPIPYKRIA